MGIISASGLRNTISSEWKRQTVQLLGPITGSTFSATRSNPEEIDKLEQGKQYGWPPEEDGMGKREDLIRNRAQQIWERDGKKDGDQERHRSQAEQELKEQQVGKEGARDIEASPAPTRVVRKASPPGLNSPS